MQYVLISSEEHPLDGGAVPPKVVRVDPFFIDEAPVTNKEFGKFIQSTYYETEAEKFGWSFVLSSFLPNAETLETAEVDPEAVRCILQATHCSDVYDIAFCAFYAVWLHSPISTSSYIMIRRKTG